MFLQNALQKCTHSQMFFKIGVLINFLIFKRKYLCWSLFLIKLQDWWSATLLKKRSQHRCFPVSITKCLRSFFIEHLRWLLPRMVEEFLRISKGGFTQSDLFDLTNVNVSIAKSWQLSALNLYELIFKRSDEFYLFRFVWRDFKTQ